MGRIASEILEWDVLRREEIQFGLKLCLLLLLLGQILQLRQPSKNFVGKRLRCEVHESTVSSVAQFGESLRRNKLNGIQESSVHRWQLILLR